MLICFLPNLVNVAALSRPDSWDQRQGHSWESSRCEQWEWSWSNDCTHQYVETPKESS